MLASAAASRSSARLHEATGAKLQEVPYRSSVAVIGPDLRTDRRFFDSATAPFLSESKQVKASRALVAAAEGRADLPT